MSEFTQSPVITIPAHFITIETEKSDSKNLTYKIPRYNRFFFNDDCFCTYFGLLFGVELSNRQDTAPLQRVQLNFERRRAMSIVKEGWLENAHT